MPLTLFQFQKHFMIRTFSIKLTQFEKTGPRYFFNFAGKSDNYIPFLKSKVKPRKI